MSKQLSYQLFDLIKSLTKTEKRMFKLYAKRNFNAKELKFIQVFDIIDKMRNYEETKIFEKFQKEKASSLSNIKSNLYEQILISLRIVNRRNPKIIALEQFSYAFSLYQKGLYSQSLNMLEKAKIYALNVNDNILMLKIIDFEKLIEDRNITHQHQQRAKELIEQSESIKNQIYADEQWSNLSLQLYDYYLKYGHIKNEKQLLTIKDFFEQEISKIHRKELSFTGKIYKYKCYVWYYYIIQEFVSCYNYSLKWINEFDKNEDNKKYHSELYIRGLHNSLSSLFYCDDKIRFEKILKILTNFVYDNYSNFSFNTKKQAFIYIETAQINLYFLKGEYSKGAAQVINFEKKLDQYKKYIDTYRILVFDYKNACLYFGSGDYKNSIKLLNKIINNKQLSIKEDIQSFARILNIIAHYELGNDEVLNYQIKNTYRFLLKVKDLDAVQKLVLKSIKNNAYADRNNLLEEFKKFKEEYLKLLNNKYEWRSTLYLDILSWLDSKIEKKTVEQVIFEKKNFKN